MSERLAARLVEFSRALRDEGIAMPPHAAPRLAAALDAVGLARLDDVYVALRATAITRVADVSRFDTVFNRFFGGATAAGDDPPARDATSAATTTMPVFAAADGVSGDGSSALEEVGASAAERLRHRDFDELDPMELAAVRRLIAAMAWHPAEARSRRWQPAARGARPDLRRTLRAVAGPTGDLLPLARSERKRRRRPLIVLADVSGSMARYTEIFMYFLHAARGRLGRVEGFVFSTRLTRITRELSVRRPAAALDRIGNTVADWSGGTRIGEALAEFNRAWGRRVTRGGAIVLVVSDGWDTGDPDLLDVEMARLARSVHRVVWLSPHAGRAGYEPATRGMRTVLPYVDDLLAAATVADLEGVVALLESVPAVRRPRDRRIAVL